MAKTRKETANQALNEILETTQKISCTVKDQYDSIKRDVDLLRGLSRTLYEARVSLENILDPQGSIRGIPWDMAYVVDKIIQRYGYENVIINSGNYYVPCPEDGLYQRITFDGGLSSEKYRIEKEYDDDIDGDRRATYYKVYNLHGEQVF